MIALKKTTGDRFVPLAASILLGSVLACAGVAEMQAPETLVPALLVIMPSTIEPSTGLLAACLIAGIEVALGVGIIFFRSQSRWAISVFVLLSGYTGYLIWLLTLPHAPRCGCLGVRLGSTPAQEHWAGILRNLGLLMCAVLALQRKRESAPDTIHPSIA